MLKRRLSVLAAALGLMALLMPFTAAQASAPPAPNANGFENASDVATYPGTDTNAVFDVTRVPSGTDGIAASSGAYFAEAAQNVYNGPLTQFHRFGGYSSTFPAGGYTTSIDVYLDMSKATGANDLRFDWSSAISDTATPPLHRRDFIFSVGTDPTTANQFKMSASGNAPGWPSNPGNDPFAISTTGWYTLEHRFYDAGGGVLAVDMSVLQGMNVLHTWTLSNNADVIGTTVGGNRYGWLVYNTFPFLALDNVTRSGTVAPTPRSIKQAVLAEMQAQALLPMDGDTAKKIDEGIKHLTKSVNSPAWIDDSHLATKDFDPVFNEEKAAVDQIEDIKPASGITGTVETWMQSLATADRQLATIACADGWCSLPSTSSGDLQKYNDELAKGDVEFDKGAGSYDRAIEHYKNAWKAIKP